MQITLHTDENISYLAGWSGDATITNENGLTSFGNDDYMADLDAENIFRMIYYSNLDSITAMNQYFREFDSDINRRAIIFKSRLSYSYVENKVLSELNKTLTEVRNLYPDTYNFLMSLKDGLSEIKEY